MRSLFDRLFLAHPRTVEESYDQHLRVALSFAVALIAAGAAALVHALIPALFKSTASDTIRTLHARIEQRSRQSHL